MQRLPYVVLEQDKGFQHCLVAGAGNPFKNARKKSLSVFRQVKAVAANPARYAIRLYTAWSGLPTGWRGCMAAAF